MLAAVLALPTLAYPIGWDQGMYGLAGRALLRHGWHYRQFIFETKAPPIHLLFGLTDALFGSSMLALRAVDIAIMALGMVLLARFLEEYLPSPIATLGASFYVLISSYRDAFWSRLQAETAVEPVIFLALWLAARGARGRLSRAFWSGVAVGVCLAFKITLLYVAAPVAVLLWEAPPPRRARLFAAAGGGAISCFGGFLLACLPGGLLGAMWRTQVNYTSHMNFDLYAAGSTPLREAAEQFWRWAQSVTPAAVVLAAFCLTQVRRSPLIRTLLLWLASAAAVVIVQGRYHVYHFSSLIPPVAAAAAVTIGTLLDAFRRASRSDGGAGSAGFRYVSALALSASVGAILIPCASNAIPAGRALLHSRERERFQVDLWRDRTPMNWTGAAFDEYFDAVRLVRKTTSPGDRVFSANGPLILYLADREPCDRYVFQEWMYILITYGKHASPAILRAHDEVWKSLETCRPKVAIFLRQPVVFRRRVPPPAPAEQYPSNAAEVREMLRRDYVRVHGFTTMWVYLRRDVPVPPGVRVAGSA
jgi:Dolichyl-phosphate-mannose-protein mannosyltransferase